MPPQVGLALAAVVAPALAVAPVELPKVHRCAPGSDDWLDCMNEKVFECGDLRTAHEKAMEANPTFGDLSKLSKAAALYLSLEQEMKEAWSDGDGKLTFKTDGFKVYYYQAVEGISYCYDTMGMLEESIPYFDELLRADRCGMTSSNMSAYEQCSGVMHAKLITYSRQFGKPEAAEEYFKRAKKVEYNGAKVHLWKDSWQTPTWFTPRLSRRPFWTEHLPLASWLEENSGVFMREFKAFLSDRRFNRDFKQNDHPLLTAGSWSEHKVFNGRTWSKACHDVITETCRLLQNREEFSVIPAELNKLRGPLFLGEINYFRLAPGARLKPHSGASNAKLYCHLGLVTPQGSWLRVADNPLARWEAGRALCFDDSYEHEAWNNGSEPRYVLMGSLWHPELKAQKRQDWMEAQGIVEPPTRYSPPRQQSGPSEAAPHVGGLADRLRAMEARLGQAQADAQVALAKVAKVENELSALRGELAALASALGSEPSRVAAGSGARGEL